MEAFDAATGAQQWIAPVGEFSGSAPALVNSILIVGSDSGELVGLDADTGAESWRVTVPKKVDIDLNQESPPLVGNGWVFVNDDEGGVVGLSWPDGGTPDPAAR
jgi:outer membrane protein assembly factor BamB